MKVRLIAFLATAAMLVAAGATPDAKAPYSRIVAFGTSLSDPGNAFALVGGTNTPPDYDVDPLLVPSSPYTRGGHHLSNGATWIEQFARGRGLSGSTRPAFASEGKGSNYAVAAARAREDGQNLNFPTQVDAFLNDFGGVAPSDALYAIDMGGNDIRDAIQAFDPDDPTESFAILQDATVSIAENIQRLHSFGARRFLVWRAPNLALTPALRRAALANPQIATLATMLSVAFNNALDGAVLQLSALPGIEIVRLDAFELIGAIAADPGAFGLTNATTACITPSVAPFHCDRPDEFLFWDGIHPTAAGHAILAREAARVLGQ